MRDLWRRLFGRLQRDEEWREEIETHLEISEEWHRTQGDLAGDAHGIARRKFGNQLRTIERIRAVHVKAWIESLLQDVSHAVRGFRRAPVFTIVAIVTIAAGVGASTAVFSAIDPLLFRALPYPHDQQLVSLGYFGPVDDNEFNVVSSYLQWRSQQTVFQSMTSMRPGTQCDFQAGEAPQQLSCFAVESNFLRTFGIAPALGRDFTEEDDGPGAPTVVLISHALWTNSFGSDRDVLGRTVTVDVGPARIIGVLARDFQMPQLGDADVLFPERLDASRPRAANASAPLRTFARLKDGVSIEQARQQLLPIYEDTLRQDVPSQLLLEVRLVIRPLRERQIHDVKLASWMLFGAVLALLGVACANTANLLLARSASRRREMSVRAAVGAGRIRLIRQTLTESIVLGVMGGAVGCLLAWLLLTAFVRLAPEGLVRMNQAHIDFRVLLFALGISLATALLFGIAPALERPRAEALMSWRAAGSAPTFFRKALIAVQVGISLVLLTGAALFLRSLWRLENQPLGFEPERVVTASFTLRPQRYGPAPVQNGFFQRLEARLQSIPGGNVFALSDSIPPRGSMGRPYSNMRIVGRPPLATSGGLVSFRWVTPGYFQAMGIRILAGRPFSESERTSGSSPVILSATLARRIFGSEDPLGHLIQLNDTEPGLPIVGVAADAKNNGISGAADPEYYRLRMNGSLQIPRTAVAVFRTSIDPAILTPWIRREFASIDQALPVTIGTLAERVDRLRDRPRFIAMLLTLFAGVSVLLAAVGLYGVISFLVTERTREIGIRVAMGAKPRDILLMVQAHAAVWAGLGITFGVAGSFALTRTVRGLLFETSPTDPASLVAAVGLLAAVSAMAAWFPSRRAARVDPLEALRQDG